MKMKWIILVLLIPFTGFTQEEPISLNVSASQISDSSYRVDLRVSIKENWYAYYENNSSLDIEPLSILFDPETVSSWASLTVASIPASLYDPIFNTVLKVFRGNIEASQHIIVRSGTPFLKLTVTVYTSDGAQFIPVSKDLTVQLPNATQATSPANSIKLSSIDINSPVSSCGDKPNHNKTLLTIFLLGFGGGLIALLTPCVFPMVPVTVSFFTGRAPSKKKAIKNGLFYGSFIFLIYLLASVPFHLLSNINPQILNSISTNAWVNILFFAVFLFFSLSLFGLFEIRLPGSIATRADSKGNLSSLSGIFFMALTLAIVSFSCTGPILGSLLVGSLSSDGGAWQLTAGMGGFGLALALPFGLFAMFPQWLKRLPKSGSWMETLKKSLAFIELALAFKFLSNADLVEHWGLLKREVFIGVWLILSLCLASYLLGLFDKKTWLSLQNADKLKKRISWPKKAFGVFFLLFAVYLIPGLTQTSYANLKLLSGFAPPLSYSIYGKKNVEGKGIEPDVINDYGKALQLAKAQNKPLLIDFTGWACVNCRKMEEHVWPIEEIASIIKEKYILVSLYVDDREKLPVTERFQYSDRKGKQRSITTLGDKWSTFQSENFNYVSQPLYVILSPDEKLMNNPVGYTPSVSEYRKWLECGLNAFAGTGDTNQNTSLSKK